MSYSSSYRKLFRINIVHDYFLNSGTTAFGDLDAGLRAKIMNDYAFDSFLKIVPLPETLAIMRNQKLLLHTDPSGFEIVAGYIPVAGTQPSSYEPFIPLDAGTELKFAVRIGDPYFENYTNLAIVKNRVFYFSNVKPAGVSSFQQIPLQGQGSPTITDSFRMPAAVSDALTRSFSQLDRVGLLGIISLRMHGDDSDRNVTDSDDKIPAIPRSFVLGFANRSMTWKYRYGNTGFFAETNEVLPLTRNGYITIGWADDLTVGSTDPNADFQTFNPGKYHYPGPDVANVVKTASNNYQSVIYI